MSFILIVRNVRMVLKVICFFPSEIVWWRIVINSYDISCEMAKAGIQVLSRIGFLSDVGPEITKSCKCETVYGRVVRIRDCG